MPRNGSDDALRRSSTAVTAVEGLLAYAQTQRRWGRGAIRSADRAIAMSRALVAESPEHTPLLARALRTAARLHLRRGRPGDALPPAEEAAGLARQWGGAQLTLCLHCLADVYRSLHRHADALALMSEADDHPPSE
jgi:hypothetical protein